MFCDGCWFYKFWQIHLWDLFNQELFGSTGFIYLLICPQHIQVFWQNETDLRLQFDQRSDKSTRSVTVLVILPKVQMFYPVVCFFQQIHVFLLFFFFLPWSTFSKGTLSDKSTSLVTDVDVQIQIRIQIHVLIQGLTRGSFRSFVFRCRIFSLNHVRFLFFFGFLFFNRLLLLLMWLKLWRIF